MTARMSSELVTKYNTKRKSFQNPAVLLVLLLLTVTKTQEKNYN